MGCSHSLPPQPADDNPGVLKLSEIVVRDRNNDDLGVSERCPKTTSTTAEELDKPDKLTPLVPEQRWDLRSAEITVKEHIADGGYCMVLACEMRFRSTAISSHNSPAAIKMPLDRCDDPAEAVADLSNEIAILKQLGYHPHLIGVFGAGGTRGGTSAVSVPFIVLERLQKKNLAQQLGTDREDPSLLGRARTRKVRGRFPFRRRLGLGLQLATLLRYLHWEAVPNSFVIHRDLKSSNIGISEDGQLKVFDFGLARIVERRNSLTERYMMTGKTGSQRCMAPEVFSESPYNEKADIFSFAIVLWEILMLRKPFGGMSAYQHSRRVFGQGARPPLDRRWPAGLGDLLEQCWRADPESRPSAVEASNTLSGVLDRVNDLEDGADFDKL